MPINRRKPYKYKKRDLTAVERAFAVSASMHRMATNKEIAALFDPPTTKDAIAKLVRRIRDRADQEGISITNPTLYETLPGRGRPELLDDAQKKRIIEIVTQDRAHREKEPLQAIKDGDFDELPPMSVSTFENVMYEAGIAINGRSRTTPIDIRKATLRIQLQKVCIYR
ncbi:hypothetical protein BU23DRAFT_561805 [Bimuria novae-zelandiae CBS 107.79]|uniref:Transposase Tc1-like domain-containing protein n=1 Tax=Bimuria novae-zelandiae CBS 107.79 TaxID=1447943 RepID=A0A6A5UI70_9PLEO|nr:hypothetical protein BU23DRAFT_561805 [Bimuria novae-zelandiae CBS 107.79]